MKNTLKKGIIISLLAMTLVVSFAKWKQFFPSLNPSISTFCGDDEGLPDIVQV